MKKCILDQLVIDQQDQVIVKSDKCQPNTNNTVKVIKFTQDTDNICPLINDKSRS